jgi:AcrR family transcriptional regulator
MYSTIMSVILPPTMPLQYNTVVYLKDRPQRNPTNRPGRARDASIDDRILAAAKDHLSRYGFEGMSLAAVAHDAGTTRQTLYRRWPTKADLAAAVVGTIEDPATRAATHLDPFAALVAELADFARGVSLPGRLSLVGAMLQDTADPGVVARYRGRVIAPRRQRIAVILREAQELHLIDPEADLEVAVTMCTGSWYARALAGDRPPTDWPTRTASLVWRAVGGDAPNGATPPKRMGGRR